MYAAIGETEEHDMRKLRARVRTGQHFACVCQDFSGGLSQAQLDNTAYGLVHNVASLRDHLKRWASHNARDKEKVEAALRASTPLQIIIDLSNNDKHGHPPRDGGKSGLSPRLTNVRRAMRLTTKSERGSWVGLTLDARGQPVVHGPGEAKAVLTGDIVDGAGTHIGELCDVASEAVGAWEQLLQAYRLPSIQ